MKIYEIILTVDGDEEDQELIYLIRAESLESSLAKFSVAYPDLIDKVVAVHITSVEDLIL